MFAAATPKAAKRRPYSWTSRNNCAQILSERLSEMLSLVSAAPAPLCRIPRLRSCNEASVCLAIDTISRAKTSYWDVIFSETDAMISACISFRYMCITLIFHKCLERLEDTCNVRRVATGKRSICHTIRCNDTFGLL